MICPYGTKYNNQSPGFCSEHLKHHSNTPPLHHSGQLDADAVPRANLITSTFLKLIGTLSADFYSLGYGVIPGRRRQYTISSYATRTRETRSSAPQSNRGWI